MSFYNSKEEFSTGTPQYKQVKGYSSRFSKTKTKGSSGKQLLPYYQQKAAIIIQKYWRNHMAFRRLFYEKLYEQIYFNNKASLSIISNKRHYLKAIQSQVAGLEKINSLKIQNKTQQSKIGMKNLAKQCVGLTFKLQKKMLAQEQLQNLVRQKSIADQNIEKLKKIKYDMNEYVLKNLTQKQQILLRQIKQANTHLLKIVSEKNSLKHKLKEQALDLQQIRRY